MNVSLTPQLEEMVRLKVDSGLYRTASEVVRDALRLLEERDRIREMRLQDLRAEIQKGLDGGPSVPGDKVFAELREKAERRRRQSE